MGRGTVSKADSVRARLLLSGGVPLVHVLPDHVQCTPSPALLIVILPSDRLGESQLQTTRSIHILIISA